MTVSGSEVFEFSVESESRLGRSIGLIGVERRERRPWSPALCVLGYLEVTEVRSLPQCALASLPTSMNSGKYIAMTMVPIVTPRNMIIAGSIKLSKLAMAASTSCS